MIVDIIKRLKPFLSSPSKAVAKATALAVSRLQAKQYLANAYANYDNLSEEQKTKIFSELKNISSIYSMDFIIKGINDSSPYVKALALKAAIEVKEPKLIEKVLPLIHDGEPVVRKLCYQFLGLFPLKQLADVLNKRIEKEDNEEALIALIETLGEIGAQSSLPFLLDSLERLKSEKLLIATIEAIGKLKL